MHKHLQCHHTITADTTHTEKYALHTIKGMKNELEDGPAF